MESLRIIKGDVEYIDSLLESNINVLDKHGQSLLHYLILGNQFDIIKKIDFSTVNINFLNQHKETPLVLAISKNKSLIASYLLNNKADVSICDRFQNYPIHYAASFDNVELIHDLIEHGNYVNQQNKSGKTPLMFAAENGCLDSYFALLQKNANINRLDKNLNTIMHFAIRGNNEKIIKSVIENTDTYHNCNINKEFIIHYAIDYSTLPVIKLLLEHGLSLDVMRADGFTAHEQAQFSSNLTVTSYINNLANKNKYTKYKDHYPLHNAIKSRDYRLIEFHLSFCDNIREKDSYGDTIFDLMISSYDPNMIFILKQYGHDILQQCRNQLTIKDYILFSENDKFKIKMNKIFNT